MVSDVPADLADHPRYEVLQLLGQGGMGAVYKARHRKMDRFVALKVINANLLDNPKAVERFQREVKAAAKLDHPNIVRAHDADEAGGTHFLVMEFVEGTDLAKYVEKKGPLPVALACHFIRQAALGLEHAHQHGMVHRDIKPHNLMLASPVASRANPVASAPGVIKVMDFGLALVARETASAAGLTGENALMGTVDYIAPEQAEDAHKADIRADIYSLGCSLCHLLVGRPLLEGASVTQKLAAHLMGKLPLGDLPASVPAELRTVLAKMVAKDPANRYQTPAEVAQALVPFVGKVPSRRVETAAPALRQNPEQLPASATEAPGGLETVPAAPSADRAVQRAKKAARKKKRQAARKWSAVPMRLVELVGEAWKSSGWLIGGGIVGGALLIGLVVLCAGGVSRMNMPGGTAARSSAKVRQIMQAMHNHERAFKSFPPSANAASDSDGKPLLSWRVHLLPYLDEVQLYRQFRLNEPWDSEHNRTLSDKMPDVYRSRGIARDGNRTGFVLFIDPQMYRIQRLGPGGSARGPTIGQIPDGIKNTLFVVEVGPDLAVPWTRPADLAFDPAQPLAALGALPSDGILGGFADGAVRRIRPDIKPDVFRALLTPSGGEVIALERDVELR